MIQANAISPYQGEPNHKLSMLQIIGPYLDEWQRVIYKVIITFHRRLRQEAAHVDQARDHLGAYNLWLQPASFLPMNLCQQPDACPQALEVPCSISKNMSKGFAPCKKAV